jgi:hypothetical protein
MLHRSSTEERLRRSVGSWEPHAREVGGGGGGRVSPRSCCALEITREGSRFIAFGDERRIGAALALDSCSGRRWWR